MPANSSITAPSLKLHRDTGFGEVSNICSSVETAGKPPIPVTGTALAVNNLTLGVAAHLPCSTGRGGARNRIDRESIALTAAQVAHLRAAERHSKAIGAPFTRMVTIHWEAAGVPLTGMARATGRFTDLLTKALARHGSGTAWLWTHENGDGKGGHCHLLAHIPADLVTVITGLQRGWLRRITGNPYRPRVIRSRPIGGWLGLEISNPQLHAVNLEAALAYILKAANREAASQFALDKLQPGGRVIGKRCGTSQNIGAKARNAKE
tara:strand:+ start:14819 stop:15613 length:795 start_codon:yes stop_codon:yes gene_type:complete